MLIVILASVLLALILASGSIYGWPHVLNQLDSGHLAHSLVLITMCFILWRVRRYCFKYGFLSGSIIGTIQNLAIILMWNEFVSHHPNHGNLEALYYDQNPYTFITYKVTIIIGIPIIAVVYGLILGSCAWLIGVLVRMHAKEN